MFRYCADVDCYKETPAGRLHRVGWDNFFRIVGPNCPPGQNCPTPL